MLDDDFKVYLIEANTNPCLTTPCPLLTRIISNLLDSTFRIALDPLFHPHDFSQAKRSNANDILNEIKYYLVFDERIDGPFLNELMQKNQQAKERQACNGKSVFFEPGVGLGKGGVVIHCCFLCP